MDADSKSNTAYPNSLRFCTVCNSYMRKDTTLNRVVWTCTACPQKIPGTSVDCLIASDQVGGTELSLTQVSNVPTDTAPCRVRQDPPCPVCGRDYMSTTIVGATYTYKFICQCGREVKQ